MKKLNLSKEQIVQAFKKGKTIRCSGSDENSYIATTTEEINNFYDIAWVVDVYEGTSKNIDYDLIGVF